MKETEVRDHAQQVAVRIRKGLMACFALPIRDVPSVYTNDVVERSRSLLNVRRGSRHEGREKGFSVRTGPEVGVGMQATASSVEAMVTEANRSWLFGTTGRDNRVRTRGDGQEETHSTPGGAAVPAGTNELTVINRGRCGQNSGIVRERFRADVLALTPKPDYVFIYIGMNDVINDSFFTPLDQYLQNMTWMIEQARQAGIQPVICTIHYVVESVVYAHHPREKFGAETVTAKMDRYNAALRELAADRKVDMADFNAVAGRPTGHALLSDGVHLTLLGNTLLAKTFLDVVAPRLRGQETIVRVGDSLTYGHLNKGAGTSEGETYPAMLRRQQAGTFRGGG